MPFPFITIATAVAIVAGAFIKPEKTSKVFKRRRRNKRRK
jgi:hypothetical protein